MGGDISADELFGGKRESFTPTEALLEINRLRRALQVEAKRSREYFQGVLDAGLTIEALQEKLREMERMKNAVLVQHDMLEKCWKENRAEIAGLREKLRAAHEALQEIIDTDILGDKPFRKIAWKTLGAEEKPNG
jgi:hypothetical protein